MDEPFQVVAVLRGTRVFAHDHDGKVVAAEPLLEIASGRRPLSDESVEIERIEDHRTLVVEHRDDRICREIARSRRQKLFVYCAHRGSRRQPLRAKRRDHGREARHRDGDRCQRYRHAGKYRSCRTR